LCPREEEMKKEKHERVGEQFLEEKSPNAALFFSPKMMMMMMML